MTVYVIDTNSIIDLVWRRYGKRVFRSLHELIDELVDEGRLVSHMEVYRELERIDDEVFAWCKERKAIFSDEIEVMALLGGVLAKSPKIVDPRRPHRNAADPWLVAQALHLEAVVVTEEQSNPKSGTPKLPDVCQLEKIECIKLFDLMEREGWCF